MSHDDDNGTPWVAGGGVGTHGENIRRHKPNPCHVQDDKDDEAGQEDQEDRWHRRGGAGGRMRERGKRGGA